MIILKFSIENPGNLKALHSGIYIDYIIFSMTLSYFYANSLLAFFNHKK